MVKYYYGACLVETGTFGLEAEKNLVLASSNEVPVKVNYYLGRLYHGRGDWNNALRFYNRYKNNAPQGEIADTRVDELVQLCFKQVNPFVAEKGDSVVHMISPAVKPMADTLKIIGNNPLAVSAEPGKKQSEPDSVSVLPALPEKKDTTEIIKQLKPIRFIEFQVNDKVTYLVEEMFRVPEAKYEFHSASEKEFQLDSLLQAVQQLRKSYHLNVNPRMRDSLATRIQNLEYQNLVLNTEVDQLYNQSRKIEQEWWNKADYTSFEEYMHVKDSLIRLRDIQLHPPVMPDTLHIEVRDTAAVEAPADTVNVIPEPQPAQGVIYRIQIGAYNKGIPTQRKILFARLEKIRTIETMQLENGVTVYTTGNLKNYEDALKLQAQIRLEGIKDAFVIAVQNGKKITLPVDNRMIKK
jgi:hypothetical protein